MSEQTRTVRFIFLALILCALCAASSVRGATLTGTFTPIPQGTDVNLSAEGPLDWVHWGLVTESGLNRKAGVTPQIPDFAPIGFNGPYRYADNFNGYSWKDGTPTSSVTNTITGVWMYAKKDGFEIDMPADSTVKILKVYVGTFAAVGVFEAQLSGTLLFTDSSIDNRNTPMGNGPGGVYTLTYSGDSTSQTLRIKYTVGSTTLGESAPNVTLQAAALSAPGANNPPLVAITDPADFTNFAAPATVTVTANAFDLDANGAVTLVEFFEGATKLGESTASPYGFTWNSVPPGNYRLTAKAADNGGATRTSAPVDMFVNGAGGTLSGSVALPTNSVGGYQVDLTADGTSDWAHWGLASPVSFNHKAGVPLPQQISNFTTIGTNATQGLTDYVTKFSWSDGTPTGSAGPTSTGVFIQGSTNGFRITAPADTSGRTLKVYVGLYGAEGKFQAYLGDHSAPAYTDTSLRSLYGIDLAVYTLDYRAASSGQTLTVEYTARTLFDADYGNVSLEAATLSGASLPTNAPPTVAITSPTNNAAFTAPANITIAAEASDSDGAISLVEFFQNDIKLGAVTNSPYTFSWTNVNAGDYTLTVKAADNLGATGSSSPVSITVNPANVSPSVTIISPTNGAVLIAPATFTVQASASDSDGSVAEVQFFNGTIPLGIDTASPYSASADNLAAGPYTLSAVATDDLGATATNSVNIIVNSNTAAPVTLLNPLASGNRFSFSFLTESNRTYTVEHTTTLSPVNWPTLTNMVGNGNVLSATDSIQAETQQFYRVKVE